ncbi:hypothetical protein F4556_002363 [Kitasatospora gansuensis]|uniref:Uncharacterized protein n=1 Tax=Kitasatospora gansuensis TaxID=258050 RepID=A0A7W7WH68_9ACTN|nr:DUF6093 family protein [Kitasatospora gansuensis]MBB4946828.1 hypothetical protein [Kitasatospora gansuensis]
MTTEDAALAAGRAMAETRMRETVRLLRPGADVYDPGTGQTTTSSTELHSGQARVKPVEAIGEAVQAGDREVSLRRYEIALPWATVPAQPVQPGDLVEVLTSPDPRMAGLVLHVTGTQYSAAATAWRLSGEDRS